MNIPSPSPAVLWRTKGVDGNIHTNWLASCATLASASGLVGLRPERCATPYSSMYNSVLYCVILVVVVAGTNTQHKEKSAMT